MVRLAEAVGFLSVFGVVAVVVILLLKDYFKTKELNNKNKKR